MTSISTSSALPTPSVSKDRYKPRRPTASQILQEEGIKNWNDKVIMITGATSGIGIETARAFAQVGVQLILPVRNLSKGRELIEDIRKSAGDQTNITLLQLELDSLRSVRDCAAAFLKLNRPLNLLVCNAGIMATPEGMKTKDGFEAQFGTNHLGHFLLFELLKEKLLASSTPKFNSRVVMVSSSAHHYSDIDWEDLQQTNNYIPFKAYGQSKSANVLMSREIEKRYGTKGLHSNAIHPGGIRSNLQQYMTEEHLQQMISLLKDVDVNALWKTPEQGAATTVWAASSKEFEGKGGNYLEDCTYTYLIENGGPAQITGYSAHVYNEDSAKRLYDVSLKLVGL